MLFSGKAINKKFKTSNQNTWAKETKPFYCKYWKYMWWSSIEEPGIYKRVSGLKLDILEKATSSSEGLAIAFSREEEIVTDDAIKKLLTKWVIEKCSHEYGELFSSYLHDSTFRFILNLKRYELSNQYWPSSHQTVI